MTRPSAAARATVAADCRRPLLTTSDPAAHTRSPLLLQRAANERNEIDAVAKVHAQRYALVPLLKDEPVAQANLRALSQSHATSND